MKTHYANLLSHIGSRFFLGLSSFFTMPFLIKFMGIETYGLIGFLTLLSNLLGVFDMGLPAAVSREASLSRILSKPAQDTRNVIRTLEILFWFFSLVVALGLMICSDWISTKWIHSFQLGSPLVRKIVILIGLSIAIQWPQSIYSSILMGLEKQVLNNTLVTIFTLLRTYGSILFVWFFSSAPENYFLYQILLGLIQTVLMKRLAWKYLPNQSLRASFDLDQLKRIRTYAVGNSLISILSFSMTHLDKMILSTLLSLESYGYYLLAYNLSAILYHAITPIFSTYFPKLSRLVAEKSEEEIKLLYHEACQMMSILMIPAALIMVFFAPEMLQIWSRNMMSSNQSPFLVIGLVSGTFFNGLMNMPYALQLSHGVTKYSIYQNIISLIVLVPVTVLSVYYYGASGASFAWFIHNVACVLIMAPFFHRKFLPSVNKAWVFQDILFPFLSALPVVVLARILFSAAFSIYTWLLILGLTWMIATFFSMMSVALIRKKIYHLVIKNFIIKGLTQ